jgi:hypothetical protein
VIDLRYHKGQKCIIGSTFCQEGYCSTCAIHMALSVEYNPSPSERNPRIITRETNRELLRMESVQSIN